MNFENTAIGIELGSTRIKAVLIDENHKPLAYGDCEWENRLVNGIWTYSLDEVDACLQKCWAALSRDVLEKTGAKLTKTGALGVSAMMHGYLAFDAQGRQLAEFRTWRNTITGEAAEKLSALFGFNIPQRWSIAHLYQAILNGEEYIGQLAHLTTLAGYVHRRLSGIEALGIGDASGMFPIDSKARNYDRTMLDKFNSLTAEYGFTWKLEDVLPPVLTAGESAGCLTAEGALYLDPDGTLSGGIPLAPPEGDAGTGMTATNSVALYTGNVSAGTSDFAMVVVDRLPGQHRELDMVTTPSGDPVAMAHCNNCSSDLNAWVGLFSELTQLTGGSVGKGELFELLFKKALEGAPDGGGLMSYNYVSGEGITDLNEGRPLFMRLPDARLTVADFMRTLLMSALATLKIGLDILTDDEGVRIDRLFAHGGFFKTPEVGQRLLSAAAGVPVSVMDTAGEGGPYGMALLAMYMLRGNGTSLEEYLAKCVFAEAKVSEIMASDAELKGFDEFMVKYKKALPVERLSVDCYA